MTEDSTKAAGGVPGADEAPNDELTQYRMLLDRAADAIFVADAGGYYTLANDKACELVGYTREELIGLHVHDLMFPEDVKRAPPRLQYMRSGEPLLSERRLRRKDGSAALVELSAKQLPNGSFEAIAREIVQRDALQSALLQDDRLVAVGALAAGVAHEINNPLTYSLHNLEQLASDLAELERSIESAPAPDGQIEGPDHRVEGHPASLPDMRERLAVALEGVARVRDIVRDLETFSNAQSENLVPVDLRPVIESALRLGRAECRLRARVLADYGDVPPVLGNPARLAQVFFNLVVNAAQAIPEGDRTGNEIRIVLRAKGADVVVEVHDSGRGICAEHLPHVFEPFFTTRPVGLGSGLGLSVCYSVIRAHHGNIDVESTPGKGSCFSVRLPAAVGRSLAKSRGKPLPLAQGRVLDVLVVDDEPEVGRVVARMLAGVHQVTVLRSCVEAEQVLAKRPFDVVVCDVMMPDVSGAELFQRLTLAHPDLARRIVFMTGGTFTERASRFVEEVDNECLAKPFTMDELRRAVEEAAARS